MPATTPSAQPFDVYKYLRIFWRRKWFVVIPFVVATAIGVVIAYRLPDEYKSEAIIMAAKTAPTQEASLSHRNVNVRKEIQIISRNMLGYNEVKEVILSRKVDFGEKIEPEDTAQIQRLVREIVRHTRVRAVSREHVVVSHRSKDNQRCADLVNALVQRFVGEDIEAARRSAKKDLEYYQEKFGKAKARLSEIEDRIRQFVKSWPGLRGDIAVMDNDYRNARAAENEMRMKIEDFKAHLQELEEELLSTPQHLSLIAKGELPKEVLEARNRAAAAQAHFERMNEIYQPAHRRWQAAKREMDRALAYLQQVNMDDPADETKQERNPEYVRLDKQLSEAKKELGRMNKRLMQLTAEHSEKYELWRQAPELIAKREGYEEEKATAQFDVADYSKNLRNAEKEIARLKESAYSAKYRVREYGRVPHTPEKEKKFKVAALAAFIGLLIGAGFVVLMEYLDQTFKTVDDVRQSLGLAALGVIPAIYTPRDHRRRLWFRVAAASSAVFVVGIAVAIYLSVDAVQAFFRQQWQQLQTMLAAW